MATYYENYDVVIEHKVEDDANKMLEEMAENDGLDLGQELESIIRAMYLYRKTELARLDANLADVRFKLAEIEQDKNMKNYISHMNRYWKNEKG